MRKLALIAAALATAGWGTAIAEPLKLRIQFAATSQFVPLIPLAPKELYRHYGQSYVVEPKFMIGAGPALTALMANELELAALNPQSMANAVVTAKLDLRAIVQVLATDMPGYSGGQYWCREPIKKAEDMRGKTIAINSRGSSPEAAARAYLARSAPISSAARAASPRTAWPATARSASVAPAIADTTTTAGSGR